MPKLVVFKVLFIFGALLFVAKPFFGFTAFGRQSKPRISHTLLVKSFTKRKPEDLQEGYAKSQALRQLISHPPLKLASSIMVLMAILLPFIIEDITRLTRKAIADIYASLAQPAPAWLLTGKLSI